MRVRTLSRSPEFAEREAPKATVSMRSKLLGPRLPVTSRPPPRARGLREALRQVLVTRQAVLVSRTKAINELKSLIVVAPDHLRALLRGASLALQLERIEALVSRADATVEHRITVLTLRSIAARIRFLLAQTAELDPELVGLVKTHPAGPALLNQPGVGPVVAAQLLVSWSHRGRVRSEAAFAALAGVSPLEASSGQRTRHRLNRGGDRDLNRALHTVAITRMRCHPESMAYERKRTNEGKTHKDIRRSLKRSLAPVSIGACRLLLDQPNSRWSQWRARLDKHRSVIDPPQQNRVDGEEVTRQHRRRLGTAELPPRRTTTSWRRVETRRTEDVPDRGRSDPITQPDQFAVDPSMTPHRILAREPDHQLPDDSRCPRTTSNRHRLPRVGPMPSDKAPMPAQKRLRRHDSNPQQVARQHPGEHGQHEAVHRLQPRADHLPPQHRHLMTQHQQLDILHRHTTATSHHESKQQPQDRIQSADQHPTIMPNPANTGGPRLLSPTGCSPPVTAARRGAGSWSGSIWGAESGR